MSAISPALVEGERSLGAAPSRVAAIARSFLGTPYRHQGAAKGAGCDCLGLIRGVWSELYGEPAPAPPPYRPDWAEIIDGEPMLDAARRWLVSRECAAAQPGDVLLFRMSPKAAIKHCAILSAAPTPHDPHPRMVHAYWAGRWWKAGWAPGGRDGSRRPSRFRPVHSCHPGRSAQRGAPGPSAWRVPASPRVNIKRPGSRISAARFPG